MEISNGFVCLMGMGTVFIGLVCIIGLCGLINYACNRFQNKEAESLPESGAIHIPNKQEIIAGTCAVIAEELGTEIKNIRVLEFKKI